MNTDNENYALASSVMHHHHEFMPDLEKLV